MGMHTSSFRARVYRQRAETPEVESLVAGAFLLKTPRDQKEVSRVAHAVAMAVALSDLHDPGRAALLPGPRDR
ncbi:MAG TPA: hypothetical protein VM889_03190 [Candidatus Thermoplasmatota archaeon]|nr:hypothetical protein [Candidatus Thermoplasmatota archaeon]